MAIYNYLDLSTAHISVATREELDLINDVNNMTGLTVAQYKYGFFISVPESAEEIDACAVKVPKDLHDILKYARKNNCDVVRLDADAERIADLPVCEEA